ncbi:MAG: transglycosylase SLT domain-containing protein [Vicinamibacterales bacterium]
MTVHAAGTALAAARRGCPRAPRFVGLLGVSLLVAVGVVAAQSRVSGVVESPDPQAAPVQVGAPAPVADEVADPPRLRLALDVAALEHLRPGYRFWRHIFLIPDGAIAFGSPVDGRLLATVPARGPADAFTWQDPMVARLLEGRALPRETTRRRDEVARLLEPGFGLVLHNPTRGRFLRPNAERYGGFLTDWGAIYERFGVPAELGLAQAAVESGLNGTIRSEARAIGFCQWLSRNWDRLKRLSPDVLEGYNQTTQAPYCAAYLSILATKYGSFIPALSEHHTGGANVRRAIVNGERLGATDVREQYLLGGAFARDLRTLAPGTFSDVYGTYGPRSFAYAEMVFANTQTMTELAASTPQARVFAMRTTRALPLAEITRRTGLPAAEVRRFNPALVSRVPARATVYLPMHVPAFGRDVAFWQRPAPQGYQAVLDEFLQLDATVDDWDAPAFDAVLSGFARRFAATRSEEGTIMATTLAYVSQERRLNREAGIIEAFRTSDRVRRQFDEARRVWEAHLATRPSAQ